MRGIVLALLVVCAVWGLTESAQAEARSLKFQGFGPRAGFSISPDQFFIGGHGDFGDILPNTTLMLPVVEIGFGDNFTVASVGVDALFRFANEWEMWKPYLGGEVAVIFASFDPPGGGRGDTNSDLGLSGVFGVERGMGDNNRLGIEIKFKIVDAPDFKLTAHWTFGRE